MFVQHMDVILVKTLETAASDGTALAPNTQPPICNTALFRVLAQLVPSELSAARAYCYRPW